MRPFFDHNLSPRLVARLADLFRDGLGVARAGVPVCCGEAAGRRWFS